LRVTDLNDTVMQVLRPPVNSELTIAQKKKKKDIQSFLSIHGTSSISSMRVALQEIWCYCYLWTSNFRNWNFNVCELKTKSIVRRCPWKWSRSSIYILWLTLQSSTNRCDNAIITEQNA